MLKKLRVPVIFVAIIILLYFVGVIRQNSKIGKNKQKMEIVNVSYDPTRELYERYNGLFKAYYKENDCRGIWRRTAWKFIYPAFF